MRESANEIWQRDSSEDGLTLDHWIQAQEEVDAEPAAEPAAIARDPDNLQNRPPPPS
ncbi:DUF2934 domain-containing protein [Shinella sp. G-2]|uniref:DUF2934 domain-containing protein n=1 Tax=Shinella sp. G-2 TaxID=3133141 RepID=UPI003D02BB1F